NPLVTPPDECRVRSGRRVPDRSELCTHRVGGRQPRGFSRTATVRGGTVTVPVARSHVVCRTTGSMPRAWTRDSAYRRPASSGTSTVAASGDALSTTSRSEEHTSELQSRENLVCRLLLE